MRGGSGGWRLRLAGGWNMTTNTSHTAFVWGPRIAGILVALFLALYAAMARGRVDWIITVSGPLLLVGVLFLASWHHRARLHRNL